MVKILYIAAGTLSVLLGIVGIVVPGLPTTPFILLAGWFYLRSSKRLYQKLANHKQLGKYVQSYQNGLPRKAKYRTFLLMWPMILLSCIMFIHIWPIRVAVLLSGAAGTIVVWRLREPDEDNAPK